MKKQPKLKPRKLRLGKQSLRHLSWEVLEGVAANGPQSQGGCYSYVSCPLVTC